MALPADALTDVDEVQFLIQASNLIDTYLRGRYRLPMSGELGPPNTYPPELEGAALAIAAYDILAFKGFNPDQFDAVYKDRRDFYLGNTERGTKGWLDKLAAGAVNISAIIDASPTIYEGAAVVATGSLRGWDGDALNLIGEPVGYFWNAPKPD